MVRLLPPVEIVSFEMNLSSPGSSLRETARPTLYAVQSGKWALICEQVRERGRANAVGSFSAAPETTDSATQNWKLLPGDVVVITQSVQHQLLPQEHAFSGEVSCGRNGFPQVLKVVFSPPAGNENSLEEYPLVLTARSVLRSEQAEFISRATKRVSEFAELHELANLLIGLVLGMHVPQMKHPRQSELDPEIAETLLTMEREPEQPWTIELLAAKAGISRSALASKFKTQVGLPPSEHLLRVRMQLADRYLRDRRHHLKEIARLTGYQSVSAFSTAYKRWSGQSPGTRRKSGF